MKVALFGASGRTGRLVAERALAAGHEVTALLRDRARWAGDEHLSIVEGDVLDAASVEAALDGNDAAIVALGARLPTDTVSVVSEGTRRVVAGMESGSRGRLVLLSVMGVGESLSQMSFLARRIVPRVMASELADRAVAEELVRASMLQWVIVRPTRLTDGTRRGRYRAGPEVRAGVLARIARADLADFLVRQLTDDAFVGHAPTITR